MQKSNYFNIGDNGLFSSLCRWCYFVLEMIEIERKNTSAFRVSFRRILIFVTVTATVTLLLIWNHVGFILDDIFFRSWRYQSVGRPLFLIGNARSGTTWLHRLITHDSDNFTTLKTWEILFAVSITWRWLFHTLFWLDSTLLCGAWFGVISIFDSYLFGSVKVHPIGLLEAEEDEWLMVYICMSQLILFFYPMGGAVLDPVINFDFSPSGDGSDLLESKVRQQILLFYKQCVQRHMYYYAVLHAGNTQKRKPLIFVSKNPAFTLRIPSIYNAFPEARIVCLLRDPTQSIPSMISYIAIVWRTFAEPNQKYPKAKDLLGFCEAHYLFPLEHLREDKHPVHQWAFVSYHHLVSDLQKEVIHLLQRLYKIKQGVKAEGTFEDITDFSKLVPFLEVEQRQTSKRFSCNYRRLWMIDYFYSYLIY